MTKTKSPRNAGAQAIIELDGIRTAAREIRTLFPDTNRPAINTLMNTMTRELGLGQSYGAALAAHRDVSAPGALPAEYLISMTAKMTCPEWVASITTVSGAVQTTNETFRGKPVYDLRFNNIPMTGSRQDATRAAEDFIAAHPILGRADVTIRKIEARTVEPIKHLPDNLRTGRPAAQVFDPYFAQDLPAGFWAIDSVLLFELERTDPIEALLRRLAKVSEYNGATKIYRPTSDLALRIGPNEKPLLVVRMTRKLITDDPRNALPALTLPVDLLEKKMRIKITKKELPAFEQATCIGQSILSMTHAPICFRLDPICSMNGRTVADRRRPSLLVDTGAALADVPLTEIENGKRAAETDARIMTLAGIDPASQDSYKVQMLRPVKPSHARGPGYAG